jgi:cell division protein FtsB
MKRFLTSPQPIRRWLLVGGAVVLGLWLLFFDSHSLLQRYRWHQELEQVSEENRQLRLQIQQLETKLDQPLSDEVVERIAREQYGMKRPGETIYRIESKSTSR